MTDTLRCLLMYIQEQMLIVPYASVAEVIPFTQTQPYINAPPWVLGGLNWRGIEIPLITLEMIDETFSEYAPKTKAHIAIMNRVFDSKRYDFFAIILQKIPRMSRFRKEEFELVSTCLEPHLTMEILVRGEQAFIPDLLWIEETVNGLPDLQPKLVIE